MRAHFKASTTSTGKNLGRKGRKRKLLQYHVEEVTSLLPSAPKISAQSFCPWLKKTFLFGYLSKASILTVCLEILIRAASQEPA